MDQVPTVRKWPRLCENYFGFANQSKNAHYSGFVRSSLPANCKREHSRARFVFERGVFTQPRPGAVIESRPEYQIGLCLRYSFSVSRLVLLPSDLSLSEVDRYFNIRLRSSMATGCQPRTVRTCNNHRRKASQ